MEKCFLCKHKLINVEKLLLHLKIQHKLKQFDDYRCLHCGQVFGRTFSYKRHLLRHGANEKKKSAATSPRKLTTTKATITTTAITTATTNNVAASHLSEKNDSNCEIADLNFDEAERENNNNNITQLDFRENVLKFVRFNTSRAMTLKISYKLEQQILLMFPTEKLEYYRCDRRGKIYSRFCYLRQSLKNIEKKQSAPESHDGSKVIYEDVAADAVKRLRYENVDASELNELWQLSSSSRLEKIVNDCLSLSDIFKLWPEYKKPMGYRLVI
ncbi:uncharacterized protein LOC119687380 [Teleopsis dalmanni]|uniref:uncharacterized protein LOC119687380 n=1 Tax=Teleopsis dalmanni TaxID=139649 RepID=UPI0018CDE29A|nr:uncharacterized protein LOC119687380 [Teleopsis dalmanni]